MVVLKLQGGAGEVTVRAPVKPRRKPTGIVALTVRLLYVSDEVPGIMRRRTGTYLSVMALGNTPAICRKCYIHPTVLDGHMTGTLAPRFAALVERFNVQPHDGLTAEEAAVMALLTEDCR